MDRIDRAIIDHLLVDGRLPNNELADRIGLSPSPCLRRVRALESSGVITGYHASVDPVALDRGFAVLVHVEMAEQRRETIEAFEAAVLGLDEVVACRRMFGAPDYLLQIAVADIAAYEQLYMSQLTCLPGVARTTSQFAMKTVKSTPGFPW
ncbi:Lrp/AsnC family transcriptional regulator [Streptomyces sp. NPDC004838]